MSVKIHNIDVEPGDNFFIRYKGSIENSIAIATFETMIRVAGPMNCNRKEYWFSIKGVEESIAERM